LKPFTRCLWEMLTNLMIGDVDREHFEGRKRLYNSCIVCEQLRSLCSLRVSQGGFNGPPMT
jgi:hypothetical protein